MKRKELKNLAKKIAKYELIIQKNENPEEVEKAQMEIMALSGCVSRFEDIILIDELVQDILSSS